MKRYLILLILNFTFLIFNFQFVNAIEVSGHLTEDTIWGPENNPYHVVDNIYVDAGVNLTILPGTEIFIKSAPLTCLDDFSEGFWYHSGNNLAKIFWVDGSITAIGTETDSIRFTRLTDDPDHYWGIIFITEDAGTSKFQHCQLEYSGGHGIYVGLLAFGAITSKAKTLLIDSCHFSNYNSAIKVLSYNHIEDIAITDNIFNISFDINNFVDWYSPSHFFVRESILGSESPLIAGNTISGNFKVSFLSGYFIYNHVIDSQNHGVSTGGVARDIYLYKNLFEDYEKGVDVSGVEGDSIFIKDNDFIGGDGEIIIDDAYFEVSDNYLYEYRIDAAGFNDGIIINNKMINSRFALSTMSEFVHNNLIINNITGYTGGFANFSNNILSLNSNAFSFLTDNYIIENSIIIMNNEILDQPYTIYGNPIFRNCILDFELPEECIDGGGNIWVDSLQAQEIFEDIENGDFHLIEGSLAIDAGFDTTDYYYPFDMEYSHRVWDGDGDGNAVIDIGAYEYNSPSWGGIEGVTYNPDNGEPVKYVMLKINNLSNQFTFSDSVGYFNTKLPSGIYDIYCYRVFYDDVIMYEVEVEEGEFTELQIPLFEQTGVDENGIVIPSNDFGLRNYPNPFKPSGAGRGPATRISFNLAVPSKVNLIIYNIRGQKVKILLNENMDIGTQSVIWNGKNENNQSVGSGIYFYKLQTDDREITGRCVLMK